MKMRTKLLALLLAVSLLVCPVGVYAAEETSGETGEMTATSSEEKTELVEKQKEEVTTEEKQVATEEAQITKQVEKKSVYSATENSSKKVAANAVDVYEVSYAQQKMNYRDLLINLKNLTELKDRKVADKIKVTANMYYGKSICQTKTFTKSLSSITQNESKIGTLPYYGNWKIYTEFMKDNTVVEKTKVTSVPIIAEQYNIVPMNGSTPVLIFALKSFELAKNKDGDPIPTIVTLSRYRQYDWDNLPENNFANPYLTKEQNVGGGSWINLKIAAMRAYMNDLHELNPKSFFNVYLTDWNIANTLPHLVYEGKFPQECYKVTIVTDGSASYVLFKNAYGSTKHAQAKHDLMVESFEKIRDKIYAGETLDYTKLEYGDLYNYTYAILDAEKNSEWWVVRKSKDTFDIEDTAFRDKVLADSRVTSNYINNLLAKVTSDGNAEKFRKLYRFDDSEFQKTREKGKKIMMILGTSRAFEGEPEDSEEQALEKGLQPVSVYSRFVMAYYGDEYEYYYKGHPGYITESYPERVNHMTSLGMQILDSSVAAELFVFYNPDMYFSGYQSSVFQNSGNKTTDGGLFNCSKTKAENENPEYAGDMDFFVTNLGTVSADTDATTKGIIAKIEPIIEKEGIKTHSNFLVEFQDNDKYDIAIWDATTSIIYFYKQSGDQYTQVEKRDALKTQTITATKSSYNFIYGSKYSFSKYVKTNGTGMLSYTSSNPKIVSIDSNTGEVTVKGTGKVTITVRASATGIHKSASKKITVQAIAKTQKITATKSSYTFKYGSKYSFSKYVKTNGNGKLSYTSSNPKVISIKSTTGAVTVKGTGKVTITVKAGATGSYKSASKKITVYAIPKAGKLTAAKSSKRKTLKVTWNKDTYASSYQVLAATNKAFSKDKKSKTILKKSTNTCTFTKLKAKKYYYVKVRSYKTISGKKYFGSWSALKKVKVK